VERENHKDQTRGGHLSSLERGWDLKATKGMSNRGKEKKVLGPEAGEWALKKNVVFSKWK